MNVPQSVIHLSQPHTDLCWQFYNIPTTFHKKPCQVRPAILREQFVISIRNITILRRFIKYRHISHSRLLRIIPILWPDQNLLVVKLIKYTIIIMWSNVFILYRPTGSSVTRESFYCNLIYTILYCLFKTCHKFSVC